MFLSKYPIQMSDCKAFRIRFIQKVDNIKKVPEFKLNVFKILMVIFSSFHLLKTLITNAFYFVFFFKK